MFSQSFFEITDSEGEYEYVEEFSKASGKWFSLDSKGEERETGLSFTWINESGRLSSVLVPLYEIATKRIFGIIMFPTVRGCHSNEETGISSSEKSVLPLIPDATEWREVWLKIESLGTSQSNEIS